MALAYGGIDIVTAGIITSVIIWVLVQVAVMIAMRDKAVYGILFSSLPMSVFFTVLGWVPIFFGSVVAFIFALIGAVFVRDQMSGGN